MVKKKKKQPKGTKPSNLGFPNKPVSVIVSDKIVSTSEVIDVHKEIIEPIIGNTDSVSSAAPKETSGPITEQKPDPPIEPFVAPKKESKEKPFVFSATVPEGLQAKIIIPKRGFYYYWKTFLAWLKKPKLKFSKTTYSSLRQIELSGFGDFEKRSSNNNVFRNTECIQFNITNTTNEKQKFSLFNNSNKNVKIQSGATGLTYERLIELMKYEGAFSCDLTRIMSNNGTQITQQVTLLSEKSTGESCSQPLIAQNYFSAYQYQSGIIDIQFQYTIDIALQMLFVILPKTSFTITFYKTKKGDCISSYDCLLNMQGFTRKQEAIKLTFLQKLKQLFKK